MHIQDERILRVLSLGGKRSEWENELDRIEQGDTTLTRHSAGEGAIKAVQRLLVFLGYSTSASGAFLIDGDFGRGTNRGVAQFQHEHGLPLSVPREQLCYPCSFQNAKSKITAIPDVALNLETLAQMAKVAQNAIEAKEIAFGQFEHALFHLNCLHEYKLLSCSEIYLRYREPVFRAVQTLKQERGVEIDPNWIFAIIKQETSGVARPRFEQHKLSKFYREQPAESFSELRIRSMSIGLGQIMGFNYKLVGAPSARAMLYSPVGEQVLFVARFLARKKRVVEKASPSSQDFAAVARFYNGPAFARHFYHERLERWFREFQAIASSA